MTPRLALNVFADLRLARIKSALLVSYQPVTPPSRTSVPNPARRNHLRSHYVQAKRVQPVRMAMCGCGRAMSHRSQRCMGCYLQARWHHVGQKVRHAA